MFSISRVPSPDRQRHAFTLVELLVVISIIALLVGLLLPALSAAKYTARKVVSLNNMHQGAIAILAYAEDSQTFLPLAPREDQGANFWTNFYIYDYNATPKNLAYNTIGATIHPYVASNDLFMAPNHWGHLNDSVDKATCWGAAGGFYTDFGWYGNNAVTTYNVTSYSYLPWLGYEPPPPPFGLGPGPTVRLDQSVTGYFLSGPPVGVNNIALLVETVAGVGYNSWGYWDSDPTSPYKSVNFVNGEPDGGNLIFGDGSGNYVALAAYLGTMPHYKAGGYNWGNYDIMYRY